MSAVTINPVATSRSSVNLDSSAQAVTVGGDFFANDGNKLLFIKNNNGASDITLTIAIPKTVDGAAVSSKTYTILHTGAPGYLIGPFNPAYYNDASGNVALTYSSATSVIAAVITPGPQ